MQVLSAYQNSALDSLQTGAIMACSMVKPGETVEERINYALKVLHPVLALQLTCCAQTWGELCGEPAAPFVSHSPNIEYSQPASTVSAHWGHVLISSLLRWMKKCTRGNLEPRTATTASPGS